MTRPRKELISIADTPYYHIVSRCVRRAFLCGFDQQSQQDYEHRRGWIEERIRLLSSLFTIDIAAYAVMSNHYHLVIRLAPEQAEQWSDQDVIARWTTLYKASLLVQRHQQGHQLSPVEFDAVSDTVSVWRQRLTSLSWFMRSLNEPIAKEANKEDQCTGHFWEGRYKSQALRTEAALLSCMAYVDLNPIRAAMAETPEASGYTSIKERIHQLTNPQTTTNRQTLDNADKKKLLQTITQHPIKPLLAFEGNITNKEQLGLPFSLHDYLRLVDWTGRIIREDKRGAIDHHTLPILERLAVDPQQWLKESTQFERLYQKQKRPIKIAS